MNTGTINHSIREFLISWIKTIVAVNIFPINENIKEQFVEEHLQSMEVRIYEALEIFFDGPIILIGEESDFYYPIKDLLIKLASQSKSVRESWITKEVGPLAKIIVKHIEAITD